MHISPSLLLLLSMHIGPSLLIPFFGAIYLFGIHVLLRLCQLKSLKNLLNPTSKI